MRRKTKGREMKKKVLYFINRNNRFDRFIKRLWKRLDGIATSHNISSKVFVILVVGSFVIKWGIIGLGISSVATSNNGTALIFIILNRTIGLIVPAYVFIRGRGIRWYIYVTYLTFIVLDIFEVEYGLKLLAYIISIFR